MGANFMPDILTEDQNEDASLRIKKKKWKAKKSEADPQREPADSLRQAKTFRGPGKNDDIWYTDHGNKIEIMDSHDPKIVLAAMQYSSKKWGAFTVNGDEKFQTICIQLAAQYGFEIKNPELQPRLDQEKLKIAQRKEVLDALKDKPASQPTGAKSLEELETLMEMAKTGTLPDGFDRWSLATDTGWSIAHQAAASSKLPDGFDQWEIVTCTGTSVAHVAAMYGYLPDGFKTWAQADESGWSVAHQAAEYGTLPAGFEQWGIATSDGWTVAHAAAAKGNLPDGFEQWNLKNNEGQSVQDIAFGTVKNQHASIRM